MDGSLALAHAHGLDENIVVPCGLTQDYCLAGLTCHTAQGACRGGRTYEGAMLLAQFLHTGLVAED